MTVSGGDPLAHPEIVGILSDLRAAGVYVKIDTVGTALLRDSTTVFFGTKIVQRIEPETIASLVDTIGFPLDGLTAAVQRKFRREVPARAIPPGDLHLPFEVPVHGDSQQLMGGSARVVEDTPRLIEIFRDLAPRVCVNTVVHRGNVTDIVPMARLMSSLQPDLWQLFEFQPTGPLASANRETYELDSGKATVSSIDVGANGPAPGELVRSQPLTFDQIVTSARNELTGRVEMNAKSRQARDRIYFMVNDAGFAWLPASEGLTAPQTIGHIGRDRSKVLAVLEQHLYGQTA